MNVTYIYHSSFLVETATKSLLFDYFEGDLPPIDPAKPLYVFASHRHGDHFAPIIFTLAKEHPDTTFILSDDIWRKRVPEEHLDDTHFMKAGMTIQLGEDESLEVTTLKSTDEGVAFLVKTDGTYLYHAGDLNNWYWSEETPKGNADMARAYNEQIKTLEGIKLLAAFVPVDPRLGTAYDLGADELLDYTIPKYLFPMHFMDDFSVCPSYAQHAKTLGYTNLQVMVIDHRGQTFTLEE